MQFNYIDILVDERIAPKVAPVKKINNKTASMPETVFTM